jgi:hypothetical protein
MLHLLHNNRLAAVVAGGMFMALAALLMRRVLDVAPEKAPVEQRTTETAVQPLAT